MSMFSMWQWLTISSAALCGMIPSRPCTTASARSIATYLAVRFSSLQTWRIASVVKMPWKIEESMMEAAIAVPEKSETAFCNAPCAFNNGFVDHLAVGLDRGTACARGCGEHAIGPNDLVGARRHRALN